MTNQDKAKNEIYDVIIIGAGAAGMTAAIYTSRRELNTLVISKDIGGQAALTNEVENYPGFEFINGLSLMENFHQQASKWGAKFAINEVKSIEIQKGNNQFKVKTNREEFLGRTVILAFGLTPRNLNVPGEEELQGRGVTYCAICDGPLYRNKVVGVVGGGNSAIEAAVYLSQIARKVYLIHRHDKFRAEPHLMKQISEQKNIEFYCFNQIKEIKGREIIESIILNDIQKKQSEEIKLDGLFIEIGYQAKTDWLKKTLELNQSGEIIVNRDGETSQPGIFAAGDCTDTKYKQIVISAGEGAKIALQVYKYLLSNGGKVVIPDWGRCKLITKEGGVSKKAEK